MKPSNYEDVRMALECLVWALDDLMAVADRKREGDIRYGISVNASLDPWLDTALQQARRVLYETEDK